MASIGLIAGSGHFPIWVAQAIRQRGHRVCAVGLEGWTSRELAAHADRLEWLQLGEVGRLLAVFQEEAVAQAVMAGQVTKAAFLAGQMSLDAEGTKLLQGLADLRVDTLLGALAKRLTEAGVELLDSTAFLADWIPAVGVLTTAQPSETMRQEIALGRQAAKALATLDVGQTVVVKGGVIVAVEALEGTDAAIRRGAALAGPGVVVVKMAQPAHDMRFDVPVIGPTTLATLCECRAACLAIEAGKTLLLERARLIDDANRHGLVLVAVA